MGGPGSGRTREPRTPAQWQAAVDAAHAALTSDARLRDVEVVRHRWVLRRGRCRGVIPRPVGPPPTGPTAASPPPTPESR
jgi:hypothetical protein